ncbi:MAG: hypothetical protein ALAOOOJD_01544 [bacterium]|nr:hypothetical protein [bacterium]
MKKIKILLLFCALFLFVGCEKRLFHFVATLTESPAFVVDQTGAFQLTVPVISSAIQGAFDIPAGGQITRVDIESLALRATPRAGNQATALQVTAVLVENNGAQQKLFGQETFTLSSAEAPLTGLQTLDATGVERLRRKLEGYVQNTDNQPFVIQLTGTTVPSGQRLIIDLQLVMKATAKYDQCLEVPGLFSGGEKCGE